MNRSDEPLFDTRIADWLEEAPHRAPDQTLEVVLAAFPSLKQRGAWRAPWRNQQMTIPVRVGLIAAAVVLAATAIFQFTRPPQTSTGAPTPTPAPAATPSEAPPSTAAASPRSPTTTTFVSPTYGYTIEHPIPYQPTPATEAWIDGVVGNAEPWVDRFFSPTSFVGIASRPLDAAVTPATWMDAYLPSAAGRLCSVPLDSWTETTVDGAPGRRAEFECQGSLGLEVIWVVDGRGWVISGERAVVAAMLDSIELP